MRALLRFCIAFGIGIFVITRAIDFVQSTDMTFGREVAGSIMPIAQN